VATVVWQRLAHDSLHHRIADDGKTLDVDFSANDPRAFYKPRGAHRPRYRVVAPYTERVCAVNNGDVMNQGFDPVRPP
jgi:hypothetical protein